jgi:GDPmannose 4,6-dehydratase
MKKVLISGITGQDGSYLAESYLADGFEVHGIVRRSSTLARPRIDHLFNPDKLSPTQELKLHYADLNDAAALIRVISQVEPNYIINLAAQSHVAVSFEVPIESGMVTGIGAHALFEAVKIVNQDIRVYQAGSSEMFGGMLSRQTLNEECIFVPKSPYAAAKVYAHQMAKIYRESYGMFIANGILFNHESPRRGENFVSRKITLGAARIAAGQQKYLRLGNINAKRDWGHAREYIRAIRMIVEADAPDDFVVATGKSHSVQDFLDETFSILGLKWQDHIQIDSNLYRPNEVEDLLGDPSKIKNTLGWKHEISFQDLVKEMLHSDMKIVSKNG